MNTCRPIRTTCRIATGPVVLALLLMPAACGVDDDATAGSTGPVGAPASRATTPVTSPDTTAGAHDDVAIYCEFVASLPAEEPPTLEQVDAYAAVAPDEISGAVSVFAAAMEAGGGDMSMVFGDAAAAAAVNEIVAFEAETCGPAQPIDEAARTVDPSATLVELTATEYRFDGQLPSSAGRYSLVMSNAGQEPHLMILARLETDAVLQEVMASQGAEGVLQTLESDVASPGTDAAITADLAPGRWVLVCPIPDSTGISHSALGMVHEFVLR